MIEVIEDIVGINKAGQTCNPFKAVRGTKKGFYTYTLENDNTSFEAIDEDSLRGLIESGHFDGRGRVRMVPKGASKIGSAGALAVKRYKGKTLGRRET